MNELLKKIYEKVIYYEDDTQIVEQNLEKEIHKLLEPYSFRFNKEELETITELMYAIELKSLQAGFEQGIKYNSRLLLYLLSDL